MTTFTAVKTTCTRLRALAAASLGLGAVLVFASPAWASFGIETFENSIVNQEALPAAQAGSHPYAMTTTIVFDHHATGESEQPIVPDGDPKSLEVNLPAGLIVNPTATKERCTETELELTGGCSNASAVGVVTIYTGLADFGEEEGIKGIVRARSSTW